MYVRLTPRAHSDVVEGVGTSADGKSHLKARVRAIPEKGRANKALENLLARHFGFAKATLKITSGTQGRLKTISISGEPSTIREKLEKLAVS